MLLSLFSSAFISLLHPPDIPQAISERKQKIDSSPFKKVRDFFHTKHPLHLNSSYTVAIHPPGTESERQRALIESS